MQDIDKIHKLLQDEVQTIIDEEPNPERLLRLSLNDTMKQFRPKTLEQSVDYMMEFMECSCKHVAWMLFQHVQSHPEKAKTCVPGQMELIEFLFTDGVRSSLDELCRFTEADNPLEKDLNKETRDEIMEMIRKKGHLDA